MGRMAAYPGAFRSQLFPRRPEHTLSDRTMVAELSFVCIIIAPVFVLLSFYYPICYKYEEADVQLPYPLSTLRRDDERFDANPVSQVLVDQ